MQCEEVMSLPKQVNPEATYRVVVSRPLKNGVAKMLPRDTHTMSGAFLTSLIEQNGEDAIVFAEPE
jgi:hypothetical protein